MKLYVSLYIYKYMVRHNQDGYPYLNLSLFLLLLKIYGNVNFFGKINWSMNSGRRWAGVASNIKKINKKIFKTRQKVVTKLGQFTKFGHFSIFRFSVSVSESECLSCI